MNPTPPSPRDENPDPAASGHLRIRALFLEALERPEDERAGHLRAACAGDAELERSVLALLSHHGEIESAARVARHDPPDTSAPLPAFIDHFRIEARIGRGGMSVVYRARDERSGDPVAIKVLQTGLLSAAMRERFRREAQVLRRLDHPGIAHFIDMGELESADAPRPWIAMEFTDGLPLHRHLERSRPGREERLRLGAEICRAVAHAHEHGVVHRDLKPQNILVDAAGKAKVLDFGVASLVDDESRTLATTAGELVGTLRYMSPEQAGGESVTPATDVYALGLILHELLTDAFPYSVPGEPIHQAIVAILTAAPEPPSRWDATLAGDIDTIVAKALAARPEDRYADARELAADLERHLAGHPITATRPRPRGRSGRGLRSLWLAGLLLLALAGGLGLVLGSRGSPLDLPALYADLDRADQLLHMGQGSREERESARAIYEEVYAQLPRIGDQDLHTVLHRYVAWRLGEAYYFRGSTEQDLLALGRAREFMEEVTAAPFDTSQFAVLDPNLPITPRILRNGAHHGIGAKAMIHMAMARIETPRRHLESAAHFAGSASRWQAGLQGANYAGPFNGFQRDSDRAIALNDLGNAMSELAAVADSTVLLDKALLLFARVDTIPKFRGNWAAFGSFQHNFAQAYLRRGLSRSDCEDLLAALMRCEAAYEVRTRMQGGAGFAATKLIEAEAAQGLGDLATDDPERHRWLERANQALLDAEAALAEPGGRLHARLLCRRALVLDALGIEAPARVDSLFDAAAQALDGDRALIDRARMELLRGTVAVARWRRSGADTDRGLANDILAAGSALVPARQYPSLERRYREALAELR